MKKFRALLPLLITTTPIITLASCGNNHISYIDISEQGQAMAQMFIDNEIKSGTQPPIFDDILSYFYEEREEDFLETGVQMAIDGAKEYVSDVETRFVKCTALDDEYLHTYTITPLDGEYERVIYYFHGGAYLFNILFPHILQGLELAEILNAKIYMPSYGLIPQYDVEECYSYLDKVYSYIINNENKDMVFMGDSAGGGLALAYSQDLYNSEAPKLPVARVLFSPWIDVTMTNPEIESQEPTDIMLSSYGLRICGQLWAQRISMWDYHISPKYGELEDQIKTISFVGTGEIFRPDITWMHNQLLANNCNSQLVLANGLFHDFQVIYDLPEAKQAYNMVKDFLDN